MDQKCLLAVYAHPDDESFSVAGVLRHYSDAGVKTALICATAGEQGGISDPTLASPATLGQVRARELQAAGAILGIQDLTILGYPDSALSEVDEVQAVGRLVYHIRRLRPQVVITFDANGDYGHPDHIAIHRLTVSAFHKAGDPGCYPEHGAETPPHTPRKLYAHALPRSIMRQVYLQVRAGPAQVAPSASVATIPRREMGTADEAITTVIPLDGWSLAAKIAAILAHRTQVDPAGPFCPFPTGAVREWLATERFRLLYPSATEAKEHDLFADLA